MSLPRDEIDFYRAAGHHMGQRAFQDRAAEMLAAYAATYPGDAVVVDELWGAVMRLRDMEICDE